MLAALQSLTMQLLINWRILLKDDLRIWSKRNVSSIEIGHEHFV
jgi:hypothetical protein